MTWPLLAAVGLIAWAVIVLVIVAFFYAAAELERRQLSAGEVEPLGFAGGGADAIGQRVR